MNVEEVRCGYDAVARAYHGRFADELCAKPFDREWLDDFVEALDPESRVVEVGCGDGHVAHYLSHSTLGVEDLDLSPAMIGVAREAYPGLSFVVGDVLELPYEAESLDAVVSFYSIVNLEPADCRAAFAEFARVLRRGGMATIAFHIGDEKLRVESWLETDASLDFYLHPVDRVCDQLGDEGLAIVRVETRIPYPSDVEAQTNRAYVLAQRGDLPNRTRRS